MFINEYTPLSFYKVVDEMKLGNGVKYSEQLDLVVLDHKPCNAYQLTLPWLNRLYIIFLCLLNHLNVSFIV